METGDSNLVTTLVSINWEFFCLSFAISSTSSLSLLDSILRAIVRPETSWFELEKKIHTFFAILWPPITLRRNPHEERPTLMSFVSQYCLTWWYLNTASCIPHCSFQNHLSYKARISFVVSSLDVQNDERQESWKRGWSLERARVKLCEGKVEKGHWSIMVLPKEWRSIYAWTEKA